MKRTGWITAVIVSMTAGLASAQTQQPVWRPIVRGSAHSDEVPARAAVPGPLPRGAGASLGMPMVAGARTVRAVSYSPGHQPIAAGGPSRPGEVIAATTPMPAQPSPLPQVTPTPPYPEEDKGVIFASDRGHPVMLPPPAPAPLGSGPGTEPPLSAPPAMPAAGPHPPFPGPGPMPTPLAGDWKTPFPTPPLTGPPGPRSFGETIPPTRWYLGAEYLLWWTKHDRVPPLVTTGPASDGTMAGTLGLPNTTVLFGGDLDRDPRSGARFTVGYWLDCGMLNAVELSGFFLGRRSASFQADSSRFPVLARPFLDINNGRETIESVAFPGVTQGQVRVEAPSSLWGIEANCKHKLCCGPCWRVNLITGLRYLNLDESITVREDIVFVPTPTTQVSRNAVPNRRASIFDTFGTRNSFYGAQVGAEGRWLFGRVTFDVKGKLALGWTHQQVRIDGGQRFTDPDGTVQTFQGGLLAVPGANIGTFSRNRFAVVPEVGVNVGYFLTPNIRAYVGYNFLYWSSVARPGDQIDRNLDITRIPNFVIPPNTPLAVRPAPAVLLKETDFWAQGLVVGMEFTW